MKFRRGSLITALSLFSSTIVNSGKVEHERVLLTTENKDPFRASDIIKNENYIFFYPYHNIPVLLLDLNKTIEPSRVEQSGDGKFYIHPGGAGINKSIVAYVSICNHALVRPNPDRTLIKYYPPGERAVLYGGDSVICCCAHGSVYNPSDAGKVLQIPAEHPLTAVELEWDSQSDFMYARGLVGKEPPYKEVFKEEGEGRLILESAPVKRLIDYTKKIVRC